MDFINDIIIYLTHDSVLGLSTINMNELDKKFKIIDSVMNDCIKKYLQIYL